MLLAMLVLSVRMSGVLRHTGHFRTGHFGTSFSDVLGRVSDMAGIRNSLAFNGFSGAVRARPKTSENTISDKTVRNVRKNRPKCPNLVFGRSIQG
jgi:hypothetical protein